MIALHAELRCDYCKERVRVMATLKPSFYVSNGITRMFGESWQPESVPAGWKVKPGGTQACCPAHGVNW